MKMLTYCKEKLTSAQKYMLNANTSISYSHVPKLKRKKLKRNKVTSRTEIGKSAMNLNKCRAYNTCLRPYTVIPTARTLRSDSASQPQKCIARIIYEQTVRTIRPGARQRMQCKCLQQAIPSKQASEMTAALARETQTASCESHFHFPTAAHTTTQAN